MRSRVVAVASAKGSPGCTFVAVNLACRFADERLATLLVDADAEELGAGALLDAAAGVEPGLLGRAVALGGLDADLLERSSTAIGDHLRLLELGPGEDDGLDGRELAAAARERHAAVVVDLGHLHGPLQRQLTAAADWLLWVVRPDRQGLERADRVLARRPLGGASPGLVMNRLSGAVLRGAESVLTERRRMPVLARLSEQPRVAAGRRPAHRARAFRAQFADLARTLHPDLPRGGRSWP